MGPLGRFDVCARGHEPRARRTTAHFPLGQRAPVCRTVWQRRTNVWREVTSPECRRKRPRSEGADNGDVKMKSNYNYKLMLLATAAMLVASNGWSPALAEDVLSVEPCHSI